MTFLWLWQVKKHCLKSRESQWLFLDFCQTFNWLSFLMRMTGDLWHWRAARNPPTHLPQRPTSRDTTHPHMLRPSLFLYPKPTFPVPLRCPPSQVYQLSCLIVQRSTLSVAMVIQLWPSRLTHMQIVIYSRSILTKCRFYRRDTPDFSSFLPPGTMKHSSLHLENSWFEIWNTWRPQLCILR